MTSVLSQRPMPSLALAAVGLFTIAVAMTSPVLGAELGAACATDADCVGDAVCQSGVCAAAAGADLSAAALAGWDTALHFSLGTGFVFPGSGTKEPSMPMDLPMFVNLGMRRAKLDHSLSLNLAAGLTALTHDGKMLVGVGPHARVMWGDFWSLRAAAMFGGTTYALGSIGISPFAKSEGLASGFEVALAVTKLLGGDGQMQYGFLIMESTR